MIKKLIILISGSTVVCSCDNSQHCNYQNCMITKQEFANLVPRADIFFFVSTMDLTGPGQNQFFLTSNWAVKPNKIAEQNYWK